MKRELGHYDIGEYYGFNQEWYPDFMMNKGGCAATTAAEICIYLKKYCGIGTLYPYDAGAVTFDDFNRFDDPNNRESYYPFDEKNEEFVLPLPWRMG